MTAVAGAEPLDALAEHAAHEERLGRWDSAAQGYAQAFRAALGTGEMTRAVNALRGQARVRQEQRRFEEAGELAELSRTIAEAHGLTLESARALNVLGIIRYAERRWAEAEALYEEARSLATDVGDDELVGLVCQNLGVLANMQGKLREARIHYLESIGASVRSGNKEAEMMAYNNLGVACSELREWMEAQIYFERGIEIAERLDALPYLVRFLANRAKPLLQFREFSRARDTLARADEVARRTGSRVGRVEVARLRGAVARGEGDLAAAQRFLDESLALAADGGLELERAEALRELASLRADQGRHDEVRALLSAARRDFARIGAAVEVERTERMLHALG
ncbi:MAG TPA: tetratricopeptide repeat protein [Longimicrobiaceae bacterium]|nr:tetratricopeptide repeat protein [Longimicrobiaceae bacterium]